MFYHVLAYLAYMLILFLLIFLLSFRFRSKDEDLTPEQIAGKLIINYHQCHRLNLTSAFIFEKWEMKFSTDLLDAFTWWHLIHMDRLEHVFEVAILPLLMSAAAVSLSLSIHLYLCLYTLPAIFSAFFKLEQILYVLMDVGTVFFWFDVRHQSCLRCLSN